MMLIFGCHKCKVGACIRHEQELKEGEICVIACKSCDSVLGVVTGNISTADGDLVLNLLQYSAAKLSKKGFAITYLQDGEKAPTIMKVKWSQ